MWRSCRWGMVLDGKHLQRIAADGNFDKFYLFPFQTRFQTDPDPFQTWSSYIPHLSHNHCNLLMSYNADQDEALLAVKGKCSASLQKKNKEQSAPKRLAQSVCNSRPLSFPAPLIVTAPIPGQQTAGHTGNAGPYYREFRLLSVLLKCCDEIVSFKRSQDTGAKLDTET